MAPPFNPAAALWNNRRALADALGELRHVRGTLQSAMGGPRDFVRQQWLQIASCVYDFKPDLIIELGRLHGNSTCAMAVAAKMLRPKPVRILSLCLSGDFNRRSRPYLEKHLDDPSILAPVEALERDILAYDFGPAIAPARRVFIFWDAHGFEVAQAILSGLMRGLQDREHVAIVHDMADLRYLPHGFRRYGSDAQWHGAGSAAPKYIVGDVGTQYDEGIALLDFLGRNGIEFRSAESSYFAELAEAKAAVLAGLFGDDFSRLGFWYYFSLNEAGARPLTFPPPPPPPAAEAARRRGLGAVVARIFG